MTDAVNRFFNTIQEAESQSQANLVAFFVYYLTVENGSEAVSAKEVGECFTACDLATPTNVAARLSEGLKSKPQKYIKQNGRYKLHRHMRTALSKQLGAETLVAQTSATLRRLEHTLHEGPTKTFLNETIDCFEIGANRATITMAWILAIDHLYSYVLTNELTAFNSALAADKGVKLNSVSSRDDLTEIKEGKFIELCRVAKIISHDVRKILDGAIGTRNSSAHPSGVRIGNAKVISIVEDLVENVVIKYPV